MRLFLFVIALTTVVIILPGCEGLPTLPGGGTLPTVPPVDCTWSGTQWYAWGPCSEDCGGGTRDREWKQGASQGAICPTGNTTTEYEGCNEVCYNGGTVIGNGTCECYEWAAGDCCDIQLNGTTIEPIESTEMFSETETVWATSEEMGETTDYTGGGASESTELEFTTESGGAETEEAGEGTMEYTAITEEDEGAGTTASVYVEGNEVLLSTWITLGVVGAGALVSVPVVIIIFKKQMIAVTPNPM